SGANFQCKDLSSLTLRRGIFIGIRGTGVNFDSSNLYLAQFGRFSELNASSFKNALMDESNFENANMIGSSLNNTIARSANFKNATLNGANLSNGDFTSSDFSKV
ncbi:pentapeptide repeat-containing protein, partial [Escherichia coli]